MRARGWIGVDLDGTLARYDGWQGVEHIGEPIVPMIERVKKWRAAGVEVRILTARIYPLGLDPAKHAKERFQQAIDAASFIRKWMMEHLGEALPLTCYKDYGMIELWDDRCVQVLPNTGQRADGGQA